MASLKTKLQSSIRSGKINIFFLFLAISFVILLLSKLSKDYTKTISFEVNAVNLQEKQEIIKDSTHQLKITLTTYGFKLLRYYLSNPKISIDVNTATNLNNRYTWVAANDIAFIKSQFATNVKVDLVKPDTIRFDYDVHFLKNVPISLSHQVSFEPGFNLLNGFKLEPDHVKLIGPKVIVDEIDSVLTEALILKDVRSDIQKTVRLVMPEHIRTMTISSKEVNVVAKVDKFTEGKLQVSVDIVNLPANVRVNYFPKKVTVVFNVALSNYNLIKASDFTVQCDFNELSATQSTFLSPKIIKKPDLVRSAKINQNKIEFIVSQ